MTVFGALADGGDLEDDLLAHLEAWLPSYAAEIERQRGSKLPAIRSYRFVTDYERLSAQALPTCIIETSGTGSDEPDRDGEGNYRATFEVAVTIALRAADGLVARRTAQRYGSAVQAALTQHPKVSDKVTVFDLAGIDYTAEPQEKRWIASCTSTFSVELRDFLNTDLGPSDPDLDPEDWAEVEEVTTEIDKAPPS